MHSSLHGWEISLDSMWIGLKGSGKTNRMMKQFFHDVKWCLGNPMEFPPRFAISVEIQETNFWELLQEIGLRDFTRVIHVPIDDLARRLTFWRQRGEDGGTFQKTVFVDESDGEVDQKGRPIKHSHVRYKMVGNIVPIWGYWDEIHRDFRACDFKDVSIECREYMTMNEHYHDRWIFTCQNPDLVDINFRRQVHEFVLHGNASRRRMWGFKGLPVFSHYAYSNYPIKKGDKAESWGTSTFDKKVSATYKTSDLGTKGRGGADKVKGFSIGWVMGAFVVVVGLIWWIGTHGGTVLGRRLFGKHVAAATGPSVAPAAATAKVSSSPFFNGQSFSQMLPSSRFASLVTKERVADVVVRGLGVERPLLYSVSVVVSSVVLRTSWGYVELQGGVEFGRDLVYIHNMGFWRVGREPEFRGWNVLYPDRLEERK